MNIFLQAAFDYHAAGYTCLPVDEAKKSIVRYRDPAALVRSPSTIIDNFSRPRTFGIAVLGGPASDGLEVIDIDCKYDQSGMLFQQYCSRVTDVDPHLLKTLPIASTRNHGFHLFLKSSDCQGNQLLARRPLTELENRRSRFAHPKVLIETRARGGYACVFPTPGYSWLQHSLIETPVIGKEQRQLLHTIARSFNTYQDRPAPLPVLLNTGLDEQSPFFDFNARGDVVSLLVSHGWQLVATKGQRTYFKRPGDSEHRTSGDFHHGLRLFGVFSSSTVFLPGRGYRPHTVYTLLECAGDFRLAAKRLLSDGFGVPYCLRGQ